MFDRYMENMAPHMLLFGFTLIVTEDEGDLHVFCV